MPNQQPWLQNFFELVSVLKNTNFIEFKSRFQGIIKTDNVFILEKNLNYIISKCQLINTNLNRFEGTLSEEENTVLEAKVQKAIRKANDLGFIQIEGMNPNVPQYFDDLDTSVQALGFLLDGISSALETKLSKTSENLKYEYVEQTAPHVEFAPSLTGKTQSAFTISKIRPLYFTLTYQQFKNQSIYLKFKSISGALKEAAEKDFDLLKLSFNDPDNQSFNEVAKLLFNISSYNLENNFKKVKLFTLGFLVKLIEDSEQHEKGELRNDENWMRFHAERASFSYSAKSISDIYALGPKFLDIMRTKYFLFLDEFIGEYWAILIRNLARCLHLSVIVANTNSDISNLIGKIHSRTSRGGINEVWSIVVVKLDNTDWKLIKNCSSINSPQRLMDNIKNIIVRSIGYKEVGNHSIEELLSDLSLPIPPESKFIKFFRDLIYNEIPKLRPGISFLIADFIRNYNVESKDNLAMFLDKLIMFIMNFVKDRKANIGISIQGIMGTMALYLSNAFDKTRINPNIEHRKSYLNDHLYYLNNPVKYDEWMFLTFPPFESGKNLRVHSTAKNENEFSREWNIETTHFDGDELFTVLSCLFMKSKHSVYYDLLQGHNESTAKGSDTATTSNSEALKMDGNTLEVLAAVSIIDSSHRNHGSLNSSLSGQGGFDFIKNIIGNIICDPRYLRSTSISLNIPESTGKVFSLNTFLENCTFPFLYPANVEVPLFLQNLKNEGIVKVGYCERTKDKTKIDFKFEFEFSPPPQSKKTKVFTKPIEKYFAVAECKNWAIRIDSDNLLSIFEKSYKHEKTFLSLLFCNEITENFKDDLHNFCNKNTINCYKIGLKVDKVSFNVQPLHECISNGLPEMIFIIFEIKIINNFEIMK